MTYAGLSSTHARKTKTTTNFRSDLPTEQLNLKSQAPTNLENKKDPDLQEKSHRARAMDTQTVQWIRPVVTTFGIVGLSLLITFAFDRWLSGEEISKPYDTLSKSNSTDKALSNYDAWVLHMIAVLEKLSTTIGILLNLIFTTSMIILQMSASRYKSQPHTLFFFHDSTIFCALSFFASTALFANLVRFIASPNYIPRFPLIIVMLSVSITLAVLFAYFSSLFHHLHPENIIERICQVGLSAAHQSTIENLPRVMLFFLFKTPFVYFFLYSPPFTCARCIL